MSGPVKVLYVLGFGRSGSTLLDLVLGELDGFFAAGELQSLWRESLLDGRRCGCGAEVAECALWREILGSRCNELGASAEDVAALQANRLRLPELGPRFRPARQSEADWQRYARILERLYERIRDVTGARVVVDSSKLPTVGAALQRLSGVELYYVHLVRDPRAVAYSWMRKKLAADRTQHGEMERLRATRSAMTWMARQVAAERVRARARDRSLLVRYEDFVSAADTTAARIARLVGEPSATATLSYDGNAVELGTNHTVSGNPLRLQRGSVEVRADGEWEANLPSKDRAAVRAICWPMLKRYDYV